MSFFLCCDWVYQGLNNAVALDYHFAEQMIYWTDVTTQGSMIRRMHMNGSNVEVRLSLLPSIGTVRIAPCEFLDHKRVCCCFRCCTGRH